MTFKLYTLAASALIACVSYSVPAFADNGQQLTFVPRVYNDGKGDMIKPPRDWVLFGTDSVSDPYKGDASPDDRVPILCFKPISGASAPASYQSAFGNDRYKRWAPGEVGVTAKKYKVSDISSKAFGDKACDKQMPGSRMASFHQGWGWNFGAYLSQQSGHTGAVKGKVPLRAATYIRDQRANGWQQ